MQDNQVEQVERTRSADDLLLSQMSQASKPATVEVSHPQEPAPSEPSSEAPEQDKAQHGQTDEPQSPPAIENTDEYGNPVATKPDTLTWEEHERILNETIRKRIKNWSPDAQQQFMAQPPQAQPNVPHGTQEQPGDADWQQELESFVESTIGKVANKHFAAQQQAREAQQLAEFETKFNTAAERYSDFEQVVLTKPISQPMVKATMGMQDPAAFLYAAAKNHPQEIQRIADIPDPFVQATEIGRLEERMRKSRAVTSAPAPVTTTRGDVTNREPERSIDEKIHQDAQTRRRK